ncbi:MAG TPA: hypothetical protein VEB86_12900 [Chryseosolibacter sp.]|nr:hypothetical protein [Chryseosolibacter sp.]
MKKLHTTLLLLFAIVVSSAGRDFTVAVVDGTVFDETGKPIEALATLREGAMIRAEASSYVALIDNDANFFEFTGPVSVLLDTLRGVSISCLKFPALQILHASNWNYRPVHDGNEPIMFLKPFLFSTKMEFIDTVRFDWFETFVSAIGAKNGYQFKAETEYGDKLLSIKADSSSIVLPMARLTQDQIVVHVYAVDNPKHVKSYYKMLRPGGNGRRHDQNFNDRSALTNLMMGFFLEQGGQLRRAQRHYELACVYGNNMQAYQDMLKRFKSRNKL